MNSDYSITDNFDKAIKKICESKDKIVDIATEFGFNNANLFVELIEKKLGMSVEDFREKIKNKYLHNFYDYNDINLTSKIDCLHFVDKNIKELPQVIQSISVCMPDDKFKFLHEAAIIEYHGVLYASWYHCHEIELEGYTPICGKRSYDKGETWTDLEIICDDKNGGILYCPPVYGICDDKLYMFVNQMVSADHMHSLDLYCLNVDTDKFELLWSRPVPFKVNTNVVKLPNGKLMLPGRIAKLDGFPNTPAVLISDDGKIDSEWRLVKIAENGDLPDGAKLEHPEISVICADDILYMFCRNDERRVPLVYISKDFGEKWSNLHSHDIPYVNSKIYCGDLKDGRHYLICNTDKFNRSRVTLYLTDDKTIKFTKKINIFDTEEELVAPMHYPAACEYDGDLYIIATKGYKDNLRGAELFKINIGEV